MTKLIITSDIHGNYSSWLTIKNLLKPYDKLAVAGDLFDTRYGNYAHTDFQPESIKKDLNTFNHQFYYVYGNCDTPSFFPGYDTTKMFTAFNKKILLYHGHCPYTWSEDIEIFIQGHTHLCHLGKRDQQIFMNPGSITCPRNGMYTYGVIDNTSASLIELKTGNKLITIEF
ncbi:MAG: YfcE family phosphodiesterase [Proteobacteria bacterium]|nr:YfcE family phosphodiesterase [Pseudomonadota bacterium]MBU1583338.1 YfcE family phosphodiesterase [Pseudomonadota bacterium]MBU2456149.1 YfcE family phosphodiesterase [Pseudomonadota bacterium]MBU2630502.1 YfcE family phosphodiesterase [Pseudomonadota bacterium]